MIKKAFLISTICSLFFTSTLTLAKDTVSTTIDAAAYTVIAKFTVKPEQIERFLTEMKTNEIASRNEPGVVVYRVYRSSEALNVFFNLEAFTDKAAFDAHLATPHVKKLIASLDDMLEGEVKVNVVTSY